VSGAEPPLAKVIPFPVVVAPRRASDPSGAPEPEAAPAPGRVIRMSDYRLRRGSRAGARHDPQPPDLAA
jgi:hypothetical protein